eukprot:1158530-Pelagomonas_calceolata.AAC.9
MYNDSLASFEIFSFVVHAITQAFCAAGLSYCSWTAHGHQFAYTGRVQLMVPDVRSGSKTGNISSNGAGDLLHPESLFACAQGVGVVGRMALESMNKHCKATL